MPSSTSATPNGVRLRGEAARDGLEPVAVGVRLEHGHDASGRHVRLDRGQVLAQAREAHDRIGRSQPGLVRVERCVLFQDYGRRFAFSVPE